MPKLNRTSQRFIITFLTAMSLWTVWLPLTRTFSGGSSYQWGVEYFNVVYRGAGIEGDYLFLVLQAVIGITLIYMGFRNPRPPFAILLVGWHGLNFANDLYGPLIAGRRNIFYGDTGGVAYDWTLISPIITGTMFLLAFLWSIRETLSPEPVISQPGWQVRNAGFGGLFLAYLVVVVVLERTGEAHGLTDLIVVPLNILAPLLIALCLFPWSPNQRSLTAQPM